MVGRNFKRLLNTSYEISKAEFKLKTEGSWLGVFWYLLNPIIMFLLLFFVFRERLGGNIDDYPMYLLIGVVLFNLFQQITLDSSRIVRVKHRGILRSINFPRESLNMASVFTYIYSHLFEIIVLIGFAIILGISLKGFLIYIIILPFLFTFSLGCSLILSSLTLYFIDLEVIWNFALRIGFFATPIFYSIKPGTDLFFLNLFNPMFYFITWAREAILNFSFPEPWVILGAFGYSFLFLLMGLLLYSKLKSKIVEKI